MGTLPGWVMVIVGAVLLWVVSGAVLKALGWAIKLFLRILIVGILVWLMVYGYQRYTGRPLMRAEWRG